MSIYNNQKKGSLFVVATPIGNLGDITLRAIECLKKIDLIAAEDTRHTGKLLTHLNIKKPLISFHDHNEESRSFQIIDKLLEGQQVALVSDAGTPLISDPGYKLIQLCKENKIQVIPIPGPSALIAALSVAGLPTDSFRFEGFLPRKKNMKDKVLQILKDEICTLIFYESSHRIEETLIDLGDAMGPNRKITLARELTKLHESILSGDISSILNELRENNEEKKGEFVIIVSGKVDDNDEKSNQLDTFLLILLSELSVRQAANLAAKLTGSNKNLAYERALKLKN